VFFQKIFWTNFIFLDILKEKEPHSAVQKTTSFFIDPTKLQTNTNFKDAVCLGAFDFDMKFKKSQWQTIFYENNYLF
jgi:hypothetical protein